MRENIIWDQWPMEIVTGHHWAREIMLENQWTIENMVGYQPIIREIVITVGEQFLR